ncbi:UxaA family hydrolase [Paenibacillus alkaliterrae]|uniref:UxaA family hydrolase n=1 Tax=Paenibacillus alkaliterrae TaxID=320909 RepID=UPI001F47A6ED|nr:UxaA family hydrolase [Paenibacillus alkaliterrae]MCF2937960.1 UxaA family hydrolase [Paenibacillus alkaliterrae]
MKQQIADGVDALIMDNRDHVATVLREIMSGDTVRYRDDHGIREITAIDLIPFGHKIAIEVLDTGDDVCKYGEIIGRACFAILVGQHVHVHNIEGIRGRGDRAGKAGT